MSGKKFIRDFVETTWDIISYISLRVLFYGVPAIINYKFTVMVFKAIVPTLGTVLTWVLIIPLSIISYMIWMFVILYVIGLISPKLVDHFFVT